MSLCTDWKWEQRKCWKICEWLSMAFSLPSALPLFSARFEGFFCLKVSSSNLCCWWKGHFHQRKCHSAGRRFQTWLSRLGGYKPLLNRSCGISNLEQGLGMEERGTIPSPTPLLWLQKAPPPWHPFASWGENAGQHKPREKNSRGWKGYSSSLATPCSPLLDKAIRMLLLEKKKEHFKETRKEL